MRYVHEYKSGETRLDAMILADREELEALRREFDLCSMGDRPMSPPAAKLRRLIELESNAATEPDDGITGSLGHLNRTSYLADALWIIAEGSVRYSYDAKELIKICCPEYFGTEEHEADTPASPGGGKEL